MPDPAEIIAEPSPGGNFSPASSASRFDGRSLLEVFVVFALILAAVWTPQGRWNALFSLGAAACVLAFAALGPWGPREMGLSRPTAGASKILLIGALLCGAIWFSGLGLRFAGLGYRVSWNRSWQYAIWALVQQFILQSVFFIRLEPMVGGRRAVLCAASLYAAAHIPSPVLTLLSFLGGLVFSELFRRWRNLFPLGVIHAALGLTIANSLPDKWLHHMRVGIGFVKSH